MLLQLANHDWLCLQIASHQLCSNFADNCDCSCIELYDNPVYLKRFQEILEHNKKEDEKRDLIQAYCKLENELKSKEIEFIRLKEKFEDYSEIHSLLTDKLIYDGANLVKFRMESVTSQAFEVEKEILTVKEEMNTSTNKNVARYLDYCRHG